MVWIPDSEWIPEEEWRKKGGKGGSAASSSFGGRPTWQPQFQKKEWGDKGGKGEWGGRGEWGGKGSKGGEKRTKIVAEKTIWVGNVPEGTTFQELKAHAEQAGSPKWAEVFSGKGSGTGAIGYATAEEAEEAIMALNYTRLKGYALLCDPWGKKPEE